MNKSPFKRSETTWTLDRCGTPSRLVAVDERNRLAVVAEPRSGSARVTDFVARLAQTYGLPRAIKTDCAIEFVDPSFRKWLEQHAIEHMISRPAAAHARDPLRNCRTQPLEVDSGGCAPARFTANQNSSKGRRVDRTALADWAVTKLAPHVRSHGQYVAPSSRSPFSSWELKVNGHHVLLAQGVLLYPDDSDLSTVLDVWPSCARKSLSVSWQAERPWMPPTISCYKSGEWLQEIGYEVEPKLGSRASAKTR